MPSPPLPRSKIIQCDIIIQTVANDILDSIQHDAEEVVSDAANDDYPQKYLELVLAINPVRPCGHYLLSALVVTFIEGAY